MTERCRERIADLPNVVFDEADTPRESMRDADLLLSDYSGIIAEWLHTGRPLIQLTDTVSERPVPRLGYATDRLTLDAVETVSEDGYPPTVQRQRAATLADLGIPMDGRASERAAAEVLACTQ
jgi:hypothetical protein